MSVVRAKFYVSKLENPEGATAANVTLHAVCRGVENAIWSQATPAGMIQMSILNDPAFEQFEYGEEYEVLFRKVAKPVQGDGHEPKPVANKHGWYICETCGSNLASVKGEVDDEAIERHRAFWGAQPEQADA